ncbi:MAG: hypothetical protein EHM49_01955 [Deltaproteobacteria bacterium]|nr:MAG: hypothetical protein EHM49_01955 [Deltaproteobacteria bacterium]
MENKIITPGVYHISNKDYHADPCVTPSLSRSIIKDLLYRSPAHVQFGHPRLNPLYQEEEGEQKFDLGTAAHDLLLGGMEAFCIIEADDWRTKAAREERDRAREAGKTPLLVKQYNETVAMVQEGRRQILACPELKISDLEKDGDAELSYFWQEEETWLRVRPDWITKDRKLIIDYKTTGQSANPGDLIRHVISMGYDIQNSLYVRGVDAIEHSNPKFVFVFQETEQPYLCSFIGLPNDFLEMGKQKVEYGLFLWRECLSSGKWPAYPNQVCWLDLPAWALLAWEHRATETGI